ncbi:MAG: M67 family metallopeptidase [Euryarchaeota archaeon]|nr:M67 family metallopeptidase [Euryarchaeota archaeon]
MRGRSTIVLSEELVKRLEEHARKEAPREACGVLAGARKDGQRIVRKIYECKNVSRYPETTYEISPEELLRVITEIEESGLELLGFYHSHPMGLEHPSYIDVSRATWAGYSYVIVSINISSWVWNEEENKFEEEKVIIR